MTGLDPVYPADRNRGTPPNARAWAVARGEAPGSHYALTETWADQRGRYAMGEIVARGLTEAEALAHAYALNQCAGGGPGAGELIQSGGRDANG